MHPSKFTYHSGSLLFWRYIVTALSTTTAHTIVWELRQRVFVHGWKVIPDAARYLAGRSCTSRRDARFPASKPISIFTNSKELTGRHHRTEAVRRLSMRPTAPAAGYLHAVRSLSCIISTCCHPKQIGTCEPCQTSETTHAANTHVYSTCTIFHYSPSSGSQFSR